MRTLIVTEFISLDGVIDSPGGGSHPRAGWTFTDIPFVEGVVPRPVSAHAPPRARASALNSASTT